MGPTTTLLYILGIIAAVWVIYDVLTKNNKLKIELKILWIVLAIVLSIVTAIIYFFVYKYK